MAPGQHSNGDGIPPPFSHIKAPQERGVCDGERQGATPKALVQQRVLECLSAPGAILRSYERDTSCRWNVSMLLDRLNGVNMIYGLTREFDWVLAAAKKGYEMVAP